MDALEHYVNDCEKKRRRMRDRPSDLVVSQLRWLLDYLKTDHSRRFAERPSESDSTNEPPASPNR